MLVVAHRDEPHLTLLHSDTLQVISQLVIPGRVAVLGASGNHRYGFAVHRDDHAITIIDGQTAHCLGTAHTDQQPTHFHAHREQVVIFNDGSGSLSLFHEPDLDRQQIVPRTILVTQPDHGSAVIIDDLALTGYLRLGCVDVYRLGHPNPLQRFESCPQLHGATQWGNFALFGGSDGVLIIQKQGDSLTSVKIPNPPDTPPRVRVGILAAHPASEIVLGNFGEGLALIQPVQGQMTIFPLPAHPLKFIFEAGGQTALILTADGVLHRLDLAQKCIILSHALVDPVPPPKGPDGKARPTLAVAGQHIYLIEPEANRLLKVDAVTFEIQQAITLNNAPNHLIALETRA